MTDDFKYGHDVFTSGSVTTASVPTEVMRLAEQLAEIHGPVKISNESSGYHIAMADPELLMEDGVKEFNSKHLTVNAEKFYLIGKYDYKVNDTAENRRLAKMYGKYTDNRTYEPPCASSMKTGRKYRVTDLLDRKKYPPVEERYPEFASVKKSVSTGSSGKNLVDDGNGNKVPAWVGKTTPLSELPPGHPALEYLESRGFEPLALELQFEACYCYEAAPEDRATGVYYSRLPGGMKNSPKGRIVFSVVMNGVRWGYQSRYIDKMDGGKHLFWNGDEWVTISEQFDDGSAVDYFPPNDRYPSGFRPHKYINAVGGTRNKWLMGFDAAVEFNRDRKPEDRFCILVEGPLDAGKIGPPAIALMGKAFSEAQADYIAKAFGSGRICVIPDNDKAGEQGRVNIHRLLDVYNVVDVRVDGSYKDVGDMTYDEANTLLEKCDPVKQASKTRT